MIKEQDIVMLGKVLSMAQKDWTFAKLSKELQMSASEVFQGLKRAEVCRLYSSDTRTVFRGALEEFLVHGIRYVFPVEAGTIRRGMPTALSAAPLRGGIISTKEFVWPYASGDMMGVSIKPLYHTAPKIARTDPKLYEFLAIVDNFRLGRVRERELGKIKLQEWFQSNTPQ